MKAGFPMPEVRGRRHESGLTLLELLISMSLGLFVVLAATSMLLSAKAGYVAQEGGAQIQDTGRYALEIVARAVRQAAYENWDSSEAPVQAEPDSGANITGLDGHSLSATSNDITNPLTSSVNGSDMLAIRFFGAGTGNNGDGSIVNCAGFGVAAANPYEPAEKSRAWSIFYVAKNRSGEPELYCKYLGDTKWSAQAIAHGVESFQVLYGVDTDGDGMPNQVVNATAVNALDEALVLEGETAEERSQEKNRKTHWKKVVTVKLALLVRGTENARVDMLTTEYNLFGKAYADTSTDDTGVRIKEESLPEAVRNRVRKIFVSTIQLHNQSPGGA